MNNRSTDLAPLDLDEAHTRERGTRHSFGAHTKHF